MKGDAAERYLADEIALAVACNDAVEDCARFRASLRRALSGGRYWISETVLRRDSLSDFNDGCKDFSQLRALILQARAAAMNDADAVPVPRPRLDIESDEPRVPGRCGRASRYFGCQRVGCGRISLRCASMRRKIAPNNPIRGMSA
jgi:hypothetical protein